MAKRIRSQSPDVGDKSPLKIIRLLDSNMSRSGSLTSSSSEAVDMASVTSEHNDCHVGNVDETAVPADVGEQGPTDTSLKTTGSTPESPDTIFSQVVG
jgi:hypothetical protein